MRVLEAAAALIEAHGLDNVTVSMLAARASVSRGTVYSYFDSVEDVAAELWCAHSGAWIEEVLQGAPSPHTEAMLAELLGCAARVPLLREVVNTTFEGLFKDVEAVEGCKAERDAWVLAGVIGGALCRAASETDAVTGLIVGALRGMPLDSSETLGLPPTAWQDYNTVILPSLTNGSTDETTNGLVRAGVKVIASAGVSGVSLKRVCRAAGVTTGAMDTRFSGVEELLAACFEQATNAIVTANTSSSAVLQGGHPADVNAQLTVAALHPARRTWRMYRQEVHLASLHNRLVASSVKDVSEKANQAVRHAAAEAGVGEHAVEAAARINQVFSLGLGVLHELGAPVRTLDHRVPLHYLYSLFADQ
jgi:AcrR family transcriptional regulator